MDLPMHWPMDTDDVAHEKREVIQDFWRALLLDPEIFNETGVFLAEHCSPRQGVEFVLFRSGGYNISFLMTFTAGTDSGGKMLRFPIAGANMFPEEKVRNEVSIIQFISEKTSNGIIPIPVPTISGWGQRSESPANLGPYIIMDYIDHKRSIGELLEKPGRQPDDRPELNPDMSIPRLKALYRELANVVFSLSTLSLNRIGSLKQTSSSTSSSSTWEVIYPPLSLSMNELVGIGTLPQSKIPSTTYNSASSYFEALAELHIQHLKHQRNDAITSADDCRRKFVARFLFRKLIWYQELKEQWINHEDGPFPVWCDDLRPESFLVDEAEKTTGVVDWEFAYTAPVEFSNAPPWWLILRSPDRWLKGLDDWCIEYEKRLPIFLQAMRECEEEVFQARNERLEEHQRLSTRMKDSWESGDFWIVYAARSDFFFDAIYWNRIDERFFGRHDGELCDVWKERLDLLTPEEEATMEEYVALKLQENKTRVLAWDPDAYTLECMAKIDA
ncbi:hypothetical protein N7462_000001 [Penicillium macrosclerotiorum]|uniref:uncharacterized protein n=1 Tax=Penicillium macrosclerotiorum TaxID=303699 RepID=UPI002547F1B2|nr:uncharacterized protein N7462_000001 [Penicillium macrosclerotiorum]KAJ5697996.1 hypothetical protein N7462_000001 [Penicillium macrosclerotiorum]